MRNSKKAMSTNLGFLSIQKIEEHIARRGWKRLSNPRAKISNLLIQEFYANAVRTEEERANAEAYPYKSYVRGVQIDFSANNIKQILRIKDNTPGAATDFVTCQRRDQKLDEGDDVSAEELIADNIAIIAKGVQGRAKLIFPSTIYRLCKEAEVSRRGFRG
ncbi:hypothetical protein PIB30_083869, partial [Stylosanthes scabra]|nr:hypothetical protein [Stylosanthes scabra]